MDWLGGYAAEWTVTKVDPKTWADSGVIDGVKSIHIERDGTDSVPLLEAGTIQVDAHENFEECWCRIWLTATQESPERIPIATMLYQQSNAVYERGASDLVINGYSVLRPCSDRKLPYGYYAPLGSDGAVFAAKLLRDSTPAPVRTEGRFTLSNNVVFDIGASYLEAVWAVLDAGGWCIQIEGDGTIIVCPRPSTPVLSLDMVHAALLQPGVTDDLDLSDIPNRYYAIDGNETAVATNENGQSSTSYQARGRWIDVVDTSPKKVNGETLQAYANRRLRETSTVLKTRSYNREYYPGLLPYSLVAGSLPSIGLDGTLRIMSQSLECGAGILVSETAGQEVVL